MMMMIIMINFKMKISDKKIRHYNDFMSSFSMNSKVNVIYIHKYWFVKMM